MSKPNLYNYKGKSSTISEIIEISKTRQSKWQIMWAIGHGKTIEEALLPTKCYIGKTYKHWAVIDKHEKKNSRPLWKVKCNNCGIEAIKSTNRVHADLLCSNCNSRPQGETGLRQLYAIYKHAAFKRNIEFKLTLDKFKELTYENCIYCGLVPQQIITPRKSTGGSDWGDYKYNGIDRTNNSIGYVENNCVSCCKDCNYAKKQMPLNYFIDYITRLHSHISNLGLEAFKNKFEVR